MLEPNPTNTLHLNGGARSSRSMPPSPSTPPLAVPAGHASFRLLCHASRVGGVIGKSGSIIKQLRRNTSAIIRIDEPSSHSEERVITVTASNSVDKTITINDASTSDEVEVSAAQEALVRVFERILDVAAESDGVSVGPGWMVSCRLLAEISQAGSVIGKGGKVIEKIRKDSGCRLKVRVLGCHSQCLERWQTGKTRDTDRKKIEGDILAVKKVLVAVSRCIQDCSPVDRTRTITSRPHEAVSRENLPDLYTNLPPPQSSVLQPMPASSFNHASGNNSRLLEADKIPAMDLRPMQHEVVFRILCSTDRVGGVIGKGGTIVRALQNDTGASISVEASVAECNERSTEAGIEKGLHSGSRGSPFSVRLAVSSNQIGCLLGKGRAIISEMRKLSGAGIRIIGANQIPKCVSENDQVVQITGELASVQDALYNTTSRLRDNLLPSKMLNGAGTRRDYASLGLHSPVDVSHSVNHHTILTQSMDHLELSHSVDRPLSKTGAGLNPRNTHNVGRGSTSVKGGHELGSENRSVVVTNTTVEIAVPENVMGSVYGENGSSLTRLRQISGAKVVIHKPRPGTSDRIVVISGNPDETQAAQSLLQAFILNGSS
ncbi:hypothetical protein RJ639_006102 [Escallonia herrerae]|uniref:K Homology domain-containing protein n=1 Tax=Escallonia herrerae TaxID=1293975 RepID=A0AA88VVI9_9ASTE|nr:hypothetical protein RJ639_006102 [Escallonia herrerae]